MMHHTTAQNAPGSPLSGRRGVRHRYGVDGAVAFELWDSQGEMRFEVRVSEKDCTARTVRWLHTVLDAIDPAQTPLRIA